LHHDPKCLQTLALKPAQNGKKFMTNNTQT